METWLTAAWSTPCNFREMHWSMLLVWKIADDVCISDRSALCSDNKAFLWRWWLELRLAFECHEERCSLSHSFCLFGLSANQPAVFFTYTKSASSTIHQPTNITFLSTINISHSHSQANFADLLSFMLSPSRAESSSHMGTWGMKWTSAARQEGTEVWQQTSEDQQFSFLAH